MKLKTKLTLTLLPLAFAASASASAQNEQKPNIIFFFMDDLGYGDLGCYGQEKIETPNIDKLAKGGKIFTQHYSGQTVSAPSRGVMMTGLHTGHAQVRGNEESPERGNVWSHQAMLEDPYLEGQAPIDADTKTLAHMLQNEGYETACIGKWGLGAPGSDSEPNKMGFDYFYGYNCQRQAHTYYPTHLYENTSRVYLDNKVLQPATRLPKDADINDINSYAKFAQKDYAPDLMFDATIDFMEKNKDKPYFIWWTTPIPHVPLQAPQRLVDYYVEKFGSEKPYVGDYGYFPSYNPRATYAAMITYVDEQVGAIVEKLKKDGTYDNTLIMFTSDNGPAPGHGGADPEWFNSSGIFDNTANSLKTSLKEGGIRVPTIVKWNGVVEPDTKTDYISCFIDWMPTLADILGVELNQKIDGLSLMNVLKGQKGKNREYLYWEFPEGRGQVAVRAGDWKLYIDNVKKDPKVMLYNLKNDPKESKDLSKQNPAKVAYLMKIVKKAHVKPANSKFDMPQFFDAL